MKAQAGQYLEEKISLSTFRSSEALKDEIDARIKNRNKEWDFVELASRGPYLLLTFRPRQN